jgi:glycosyl transferase family 25
MNLLENTLFINLDKRIDRLTYVVKELKKVGVTNPVRVSAIQTEIGSIGCTLSHIKCLELAKKNNYDHVFICEDDITFINPSLLLENLKNNQFQIFDVFIIGGNCVPPYSYLNNNCVRVFNCQTTTGYIVKKHFYDIIINNFKESVSLLKERAINTYALDIYWKKLQKTYTFLITIPLTVTQRSDYSDIEKKNVDYTNLMLDLEKKWLFR